MRAVSVVVRAESAAPGVRTTVESALSLSRAREPGTEVVLVHDCADRTTWVWLLRLKRAHPELHLIDFGEPYGNQLARLEGARRARHSHVCFAGPGADAEALARAIREAVPRSRAIAVLREGLGASAEERLVLQSFGPGIRVPADGPLSQIGSEPETRRRRAAVLVGVGSICALTAAAVLGLRGQAPPGAVASSGGQAPGSRAEIVTDSARISATAPALERGETRSLDGPTAPKRVPAKPDKDTKPVKPRVTRANPATPVAASSESPAAPAPDSSAESSGAPPPSSESRPQKTPPAQNGQSSTPAEQSTTTEDPPAETIPAAPEQAAPGEASPPLEGLVDQGASPPPAAPAPAAPPAPPPAAPLATPPATPPGTPPVDPGPGNGNGNGHAYGHANGNGQGNGNGPKK